ncbi:type I-E CRISPR-associated protein Cas7/Cse4/CasC [Aristophania vespae]|uniref:type I-E CRISPR-associated protein Cas7/Cse4/CasC n=1 Tax=Aristophania vespae TaxID=2697033 RepID=UPI002351534C|nr:type I-E CRISPR-associated protein Cas7/Cse4/CasC [Aristophania vespae]UMM64419.1 CRISPR system Cascade subunit CasC [Aristophania vespae]
MSRFLQIHCLTFYPPSNLNRDDMGAPKTATIGNSTRIRISSQSLKRAWRTSPLFKNSLAGHMGSRTSRLAEILYKELLSKGVEEEKASKIARDIGGVFGKMKSEKDDKKHQSEQLAFISPKELEAAHLMADRIASGEKIDISKEKSALLSKADSAVDIGLFGRMFAADPNWNREAAAQVAHAITTHRITVENDFYVVVDDKKPAETDSGAAFIGNFGFGAGVFYLYLSINLDLFRKNLGDEAESGIMETALGALIEAVATVSPSGKQNSFAALARAGYILAEKGDQQPRTLAGAFIKPVNGEDIMGDSIKALEAYRGELNHIYGPGYDKDLKINVSCPQSPKLADLIKFCKE